MKTTLEKGRLINMIMSNDDEQIMDRLSKSLGLNRSDTIRFALRRFEELSASNDDLSLMVKGMMNMLIKVLSALPQDHNDPQIKKALKEYQRDYGHLFRE